MTDHSLTWNDKNFTITDSYLARGVAAQDSLDPYYYPPSKDFEDAKKTAVVLAHMDGNGSSLNVPVSDRHVHRALRAMARYYDLNKGLDGAVFAGAILAYMDSLHDNQASMNLLSLIAEEGIDHDYLKNWAVNTYHLIDPDREVRRSSASDSERAF